MLCSTEILSSSETGSVCVAAFYDQVYVGWSDGRVSLQGGGDCRLQGGRAVSQMVVLGEIGLLFALSGGTVESIDAHRLTPRPEASISLKAEVLLLATNEDTAPDFSLCLATSHKVHIYRWAGEKHEAWKVLNITSPPRDLAWSGQTLCAALEDQIILVDIASQSTQKVHEMKPSSLSHKSSRRSSWKTSAAFIAAKPGSIVCALPESRFLMVVDCLGIIIKASGEPSGNTIVWENPPSLIAYSVGFVVSLHQAGSVVEVRSVAHGGEEAIIESLQLDFSAVDLFTPAPWNAVVPRRTGLDEYASLETLAGVGGVLMLGDTPCHIVKLGSVSLEERIQELLQESDFSNALQLIKQRLVPILERQDTPDVKQSRLRKLAAKPSVTSGQCARCSVFGATDSKDVVVRFYADAGLAMLRQGNVELAFQQFNKGRLDPRELLPYFPDLVDSLDSFSPAILTPDIVFGDASFTPGNTASNNDQAPFTQASLLPILPSGDSSPDRGRALYRGMRNLLWAGRRNLLATSTSSTSADGNDGLVDEAALRVLLLFLERGNTDEQNAARVDLRELCRGPNNLNPSVHAKLLQNGGHTGLAALLLSSSRSHWKEALELWASMGTSDAAHGDSMEDAIRETVQFLRSHLEEEELVWVYSSWVLSTDPREGIKTFLVNSPLPASKVLAHLNKFDPNKRFQLVLDYLQFLCLDCGRRAFDLDLGKEFVRVLKASDKHFETNVDAFVSFVKTPQTLRQTVQDEQSDPPTEKEDNVMHNVETLEAEALVEEIENSGLGPRLPYAIVELYAKCKWHTKALEILVNKLENHDAAEAYCMRVLQESKGKNTASNPFLDLLCIYFAPENAVKFKEPSLRILEIHGNHIDPAQVISKLPAELPVRDLQGYLSFILARNVRQLSQLRIERNLSAAHNIKVRNQLMRLHKSNVSITSDTRCCACNGPIRTSPFVLDPSRKFVFHLACSESQKVLED